MTADDDNARLRAIIADARRSDPVRDAALAAEREYAPKAWTQAEEAELVEHMHGTDAERLAKLVDEANHSR